MTINLLLGGLLACGLCMVAVFYRVTGKDRDRNGDRNGDRLYIESADSLADLRSGRTGRWHN